MNKENTRQMGIDFKLFPADMIQIFHKIVWKIPKKIVKMQRFSFTLTREVLLIIYQIDTSYLSILLL